MSTQRLQGPQGQFLGEVRETSYSKKLYDKNGRFLGEFVKPSTGGVTRGYTTDRNGRRISDGDTLLSNLPSS